MPISCVCTQNSVVAHRLTAMCDLMCVVVAVSGDGAEEHGGSGRP